MDYTKLKLLTLFACILLLAAFSIPLTQHNTSIPVMPNTILSQIATTVPKGGSIEWQVDINNSFWSSVAVTSDESYIFVGGANITNTTTFEGQPMLWKFDNTGVPLWNTTTGPTGDLLSTVFNRIAISPDDNAVYAIGVLNSFNEPTLVKFDASNGDYIWTYTFSGGDGYQFYSVKVSLDSNTVYIAGSNASIYYPYPSEFYVAAIDASTGTLKSGWPYTIFLNGTYDLSLANDLALSPSGDTLYVSGYYSVVNGTNAMKLVALDTSTGLQIWNVTSEAEGKFTGIDISGDGEKIYALEDAWPNIPLIPYYNPVVPVPYANLITVNASDGEIMTNYL